MTLIDEINIHASAGKGGDGVIRWRQEKFIPKGGPAGGDGGRGGNVYALAIRDVTKLSYYRSKRSFKSENGGDGMSGSKHGANGEDTILEFPIGSIVINITSGERIDLTKDGQKELLLKGGFGGKGNEHFKSSTNVSPRRITLGKEGEEADFKIELELFADLGLVGFPNAGKSSLLNSLTQAKAKVGDYAFTTLDPNLGDLYGYIIADIPGLIEGASEGKGLGTKFLRHIKRTKKLLHLISFENDIGQGGKGMKKAYEEIRGELVSYGNGLPDKEEIILLTKTDLVDDKLVEKRVKEFKKISKNVFEVTLYDDKKVKVFQDSLVKILKK